MRFVYLTALLTNVFAIIVIDVFLWNVSWVWGAGGIIGLAGFFVGFWISGGMVIAPRDLWRNSKYSILKKKITYGNTIAAATTVIASLIFMVFEML